MSTTEHVDNNQPWTTWEELLLAFAVKRHGFHNWNSVFSELQTRTNLFTSPDSCRLKFIDLRRRFHQNDETDIDSVSWLEDLRRRRLDELRAQVVQHDLSIQSLQSKVERLEQDRVRSVKPSDPESNDLNEEVDPRAAVGGGYDGGESENQSVNASNSTGPNKGKEFGSGQNNIEPEMDDDLKIEPGMVHKRNELSDESSDSIDKDLSKQKRGGGGGGGDETKTDSDVQSSATLSRNRKNRDEADVSTSRDEVGQSINVLSLIQSHKDASFFECRLQIQEGNMYNNIIRQHMDLQTIQSNLDSGSYASSQLTFYRDLILMFTNAIIFYPKSSQEYKASQELRAIVTEKMDEHFKQLQRSEEKLSSVPSAKHALERSDSLIAKHKTSDSGPIVVCRKRSSISAKGNSDGKGEQQQQTDVGEETRTVALADLKPSPKEELGLLSSKTKDRIVTGTRSLRRSNSNLKKPMTLPNITVAATTSHSSKKEATVITKETEKNKKEETSAFKKDDNSAKKRGAADFLKRLKGNSPVKPKDDKSSAVKGNSTTAGGEQKKKNVNVDKVDGRRKITTKQAETSQMESGTSPTKRNVGRPSKKTSEAATMAVKRVRERDTEASGSGGSKQPKKRTKR